MPSSQHFYFCRELKEADKRRICLCQFGRLQGKPSVGSLHKPQMIGQNAVGLARGQRIGGFFPVVVVRLVVDHDASCENHCTENDAQIFPAIHAFEKTDVVLRQDRRMSRVQSEQWSVSSGMSLSVGKSREGKLTIRHFLPVSRK